MAVKRIEDVDREDFLTRDNGKIRDHDCKPRILDMLTMSRKFIFYIEGLMFGMK